MEDSLDEGSQVEKWSAGPVGSRLFGDQVTTVEL